MPVHLKVDNEIFVLREKDTFAMVNNSLKRVIACKPAKKITYKTEMSKLKHYAKNSIDTVVHICHSLPTS